MEQGWTSYVVPAAVLAVVLALRWRRMARPRPLRLERLWVLPASYAAVVASLYWAAPPSGSAWLFCGGALAAGAALGWQRGRLMRITLDPGTHRLNQSASPGALLFLVLLVAARLGLRRAGGVGGLGFSPAALADLLAALALGLFAAQRLEMYRRGRRLLAAARPN